MLDYVDKTQDGQVQVRDALDGLLHIRKGISFMSLVYQYMISLHLPLPLRSERTSTRNSRILLPSACHLSSLHGTWFQM
jgi:hypothetical protein